MEFDFFFPLSWGQMHFRRVIQMSCTSCPKGILLIRDTPSEEVYVLNMFRMRGSRL